mgnify:CR=1 FL=1
MTDDTLRAAVTPRILLAGFVVVILVVLGVATVTSTATLAPYNSGWDGTSTARTTIAADSTAPPVVVDTAAYSRFEGNGTLSVIIAPREPYSDREVAQLRTFLARGGTILVAEDRRTGTNQLLAQLGVSARIDGRMLRDPQQYYRSPDLPVITDTANESLIRGVEQFTLNRGTVLRSTNGTAVANTSDFAYVDRNGNGQLDRSEQLQSYPVVSSERVGAGRVLVVSDSSVFINQMLDRSGNRALLTQLIESHDRTVLDYSHAPGTPPAAVVWLWLQRTAWAQALLGGIGCVLVVLWTHRGIRRRGHQFAASIRDRVRRSPTVETVVLDANERAAFLQDQHPEWDAERVDRIAESMNHLHEPPAPETDE